MSHGSGTRTGLHLGLERIPILMRRGELVVQERSETLILGILLDVLEVPQVPGGAGSLLVFAALALVILVMSAFLSSMTGKLLAEPVAREE